MLNWFLFHFLCGQNGSAVISCCLLLHKSCRVPRMKYNTFKFNFSRNILPTFFLMFVSSHHSTISILISPSFDIVMGCGHIKLELSRASGIFMILIYNSSSLVLWRENNEKSCICEACAPISSREIVTNYL